MTKDTVLARILLAPMPEAGKLMDLLLLWAERSRARRSLREMGPERLMDIGVTPTEAQREARKPMWRT